MLAHHKAMNIAKLTYEQLRDQEVVITKPNEYVVSAASPSREAWDEYFYTMQDLGYNAWDYNGYDRFNKEMGF